ncbi:hypothetical protein AB9K35_07665 [Leisingera sp. XS_AS12]|uniref:hypothetical protein n=1 Tax=Leisingera sp. XS_AS12 TaxID=3241294 RepID=UPI003512FEE1
MDFNTYKTESLERILADQRYTEYHAEIDEILGAREGHLHVSRALELLTGVAKSGETINYKPFFEDCVGGDVQWDHTKMSQVSQFLGRLMVHCNEHGLPILSSLVVNAQSGQCGEGFFKELLKLELVSSTEDPAAAAQKHREACWAWAANL